ncbi:MAG TPA: hypothetical protein VED17_05500 [Nitrososphaerales archaeon]|nr:hypothetical protein [Nitrososphaerales archaeon]
MTVAIDYPYELWSRLTVRPCCALELVQQLSSEFHLDIDDLKLHVLLELRQMIDSGLVEVRNVDHHDIYSVLYSSDGTAIL